MFAKRQLPYVAPERRFDVPSLGRFAIEPVGTCNHATGYFVYFHAHGAEAATRGYVHFRLQFGAISLHPHWTAKPVNFDIAEGTAMLDRVIQAARALVEAFVAERPDAYLNQLIGLISSELAAERRREALSLNPASRERQARLAVIREIDAALKSWSKAGAEAKSSLDDVILNVLEPQRSAA